MDGTWQTATLEGYLKGRRTCSLPFRSINLLFFFNFLTSKEIPGTYHLIIIHFLLLQHVSFHSVIKNIDLNVASAPLQTSQMFNVKTYSNLIFFVIPAFQAKLSLYSKGNHHKHASMFRV